MGKHNLFSIMDGQSTAASSVFVGNIPYDVSEEELANLFRQFGEVVKFRLVIDQATGKGKGYGFCDFVSPEAAEAAKRMNNEVAINGRALRVDTASQSQPSSGGYRSHGAGSAHSSSKQARDLDAALAQLTIGEVYDILVEVKAWVKKDPDGARELLAQRPVLAQALLKMQTSMGMMQTAPPADLSFGAFSASNTAPVSAAAASAPVAPTVPQPQPSVMPHLPQQYAQPQQYYQMYGMPQYLGAQPQALPGLAAAPPVSDMQQDYLRIILNMSEEEVSRLSPDQQVQVRAIRGQYLR